MDKTPYSNQTARAASPSPASTPSLPSLDLSSLPPIAVLSAHMKDAEDKTIKDTLRRYHAPLVSHVSRAKIFIGKVGTKKRAEFELRSRKLIVVEEASAAKRLASPGTAVASPKKKPRRLSEEIDSTTEDEDQGAPETENEAPPDASSPPERSALVDEPTMFFKKSQSDDIVWVVKVDWLEACVHAGHLVPLQDSLVYRGRVLERPKSLSTTSVKAVFTTAANAGHDMEDRAKPDAVGTTWKAHTAHLVQTTTSEYEGIDSEFPQAPEWVKKHVKYACQRFTPANSPNQDFLEQLKKIRTARTLMEDEIGVRAYSTIIASIAAYPYKLSHARELAQLPGCDEKTAALFVEWTNTAKIQAVQDYEKDEAMTILRSFYDIWGVGVKTARHFYYHNHWTELDDIIEFGWNDLDRVQQIGVKYYAEFLVPIPRPEVEQIASVVREHAVRLRDDRISVTIVGGYRRGKAESGDVDLIVSHPELDATAGLVREIVESLEETEWITHTLTLSLKNTHRGQHALPFRSSSSSAKGAAGAGFDTLDKALVVWQNPKWPDRERDLARNPKAKNPNLHRRVDIIVAPWRTVGCAVLGWSGGTTFQRDVRRYAKAIKGWKFDSSGIRSRSTGEAVFLEGPHGVTTGTPEDAEKAVFKGLGLEFIPPEYRVTY
ncbi:hypothetical protein ACEQ8H_004519 [Pleosporales sp. CAS-2024a]